MGLLRRHSLCCQLVSDPESDHITSCWVTVSLNFMSPALADRGWQKKNCREASGTVKRNFVLGFVCSVILFLTS